MIVGVPRETGSGETRVAIVPSAVAGLLKAGNEVVFEPGAGTASGYLDAQYAAAGAQPAAARADLFQRADVVAKVRALGADPDAWRDDLALAKAGQMLVATMDPLSAPQPIAEAAARGILAFSLELVPRITRAQSMDVLSSQSNLAGYKAVLIAANALPQIFPMMMTAAGTIAPSRVLVIGAGVAGLQAIATARRLGAVVSGYDLRPAVKEQVESLGARFVQLELAAQDAQDAGGYARAMDAAFYARQTELLADVVAESDVVVTTAAVPGQRAPVLITSATVERMRPGSVIVDIAAERGGNCALTQAGTTVVHGGVSVIGPVNLPATVAHHASQLFSKNVTTFLAHVQKQGGLTPSMDDEIVSASLLTRDGSVVNARVQELLGQPAAAAS